MARALCTFDAPNGFGNGTKEIGDSASHHHIVTINDSEDWARLTAAQKVCGKTSLLLNSGYTTSAYLSIPDHEDWNFGSGNFTLHLYVNFTVVPTGYEQTFMSQYASATSYWRWGIYDSGDTHTMRFRFYNEEEKTISVELITSPETGVWYHYAITRSGSSWYFWVNGIQIGNTQTQSTALLNVASELQIGACNADNVLRGYLAEIAIHGEASYIGPFTPSKPAISGNKLLLHCQGWNHGGDYASPHFKNTAQINAYGLLLDGNSDYVYIQDNPLADSSLWSFGTQDFTLATAIYFNALPTNGNRFDLINHSYYEQALKHWKFYLKNTLGTYKLGFSYYAPVDGIVSIEMTWPAPAIETFYWIVLVRYGSTYYAYVNGTSIGNGSFDYNIQTPSGVVPLSIGASGDADAAGNYTNGRIYEVIISDKALWLQDFTTYFTWLWKNAFRIDGVDNAFATSAINNVTNPSRINGV